MLYIYRRRNSTGARDLAEGIMLGVEGVRGLQARRTKGQALQGLTQNDQVICWGDHFAAPAGVRTLNNVEPLSKFAEAKLLKEKGVATVEVSRTRPAVAAARRQAFAEPTFQFPVGRDFNATNITQLTQMINDFTNRRNLAYNAWQNQPQVPTQEWLARRNNHVGGNDLLEGLREGEFYSKKENIVEEYRLHMFRGKSIRAGRKVANATRPDGRTAPHQWIRSYDAGWVIRYDGFESTKPMRKLARAALKALGLDFGAIDIGKKADGTLIVLEVNRAPGVEGGTVEAYAKHLINWVRNPQAYANQEEE